MGGFLNRNSIDNTVNNSGNDPLKNKTSKIDRLGSFTGETAHVK